MDDIYNKIRTLTPDKRKKFMQLLEEQGVDTEELIFPIKREKLDTFPLSTSQERLWFLNQLDPQALNYCMPIGIEFSGMLNVEMLEKSINLVIERHESLRTTFKNIKGKPRQFIQEFSPIKIPLIIMNGENNYAIVNKTKKAIEQEIMKPFDLEKGSLIKSLLYKLNDKEYVFLIVMHHIIADGWSNEIIISEIFKIYKALYTKTTYDFPQINFQFIDYAVWEREFVKSKKMDVKMEYWKRKLKDLPPILDLYTRKPRPIHQKFRGKEIRLILPQYIKTRLKKICQEENVTMYMILLAAFKILLFRYSHQYDTVIGTPVAARDLPEMENIVGFFSNTIVIRSNIEENSSFSQFLLSIRSTTLEAFEHQQVPFDKIVEAINPERLLTHNPIFQIMFYFKSKKNNQIDIPDLNIKNFNIHTKSSKFDLNLVVEEKINGFELIMEYNTELYDKCIIKYMMNHYKTILRNIVNNIHQNIPSINAINIPEKRMILEKWNKTTQKYSENIFIHQLFEIQASKTPTAVAVRDKDDKITYDELNERANQVGEFLQEIGVGPEVYVGVSTERSVDSIIFMIAVFKAGGVYVPIDPSIPYDRLNIIIDDLNLKYLLTQNHLSKRFQREGLKTIFPDSQSNIKRVVNNIKSKINQNNLAYVIFTSGSTGRPKGVLIEHRGLTNLALNEMTYENYGLQVGSNVLQLVSLNFDASIFEIFVTLINGATLNILNNNLCLGEELYNVLKNKKINFAMMTPSVLETVPFGDLPDLKMLVTTGETLKFSLAKKWVKGRVIINGYGPTEVTCAATKMIVTSKNIKSLSIGRPFKNYKVYILDRNLEPVPIGVVGELYISGDGLARGYVNEPKLTSENFLQNSFSDKPNDKMYKTGDLVRYSNGGLLEFFGRVDQQVKIRGYRIEPGEIETVLNRHHSVSQSIVLLCESNLNKNKLVAYVITNKKDFNALELKKYLLSKLPNYMIPQEIIHINKIPLTKTGKINRGLLPKPNNEPQLISNSILPNTTIENKLLDIWANVLQSKRGLIGVNDNFFDIGGNSLLLLEMHSKITDISKKVTITEIFMAPSIRKLSAVLEGKSNIDIKNPIISQLSLPPKYFNKYNSSNIRNINYNLTLEGDVYDNLKNIALIEDVSINIIVLSLYILLLHGISDEENIEVQINDRQKYFFSSINIKFSQIKTFKDIIIQVSKKTIKENYSINLLKEIKRKKYSITPYFCNNTKESNNTDLFDIVLFPYITQKILKLSFKVNSSRLDLKQLKKAVQKYGFLAQNINDIYFKI